MAAQKRYKAINFDLDTHRLIELFGAKKRRKAYSDIKHFLVHNGFVHKQWSGYLSISRMSYAETYIVMDNLVLACPWLSKCVNSFDITDFMAESDALIYITNKVSPEAPDISIDDSSLFRRDPPHEGN